MLLHAGLSWPLGASFCNLGGVGIHGPTDIPARGLTAAIGVVGEARKAVRNFVESSTQVPTKTPCGREWCGDARGW